MTRESSRDPRDDEPAPVVSSFSSANDASSVVSGFSRTSQSSVTQGSRDIDSLPGREPRAQSLEPGHRHSPVRLPSSFRREPVTLGRDRYNLRGSEVETLIAVGSFRSVFTRDLEHYSDESTRDADIRSLHEQKLLDHRS